MPELPEVETTRLGITPPLLGQKVTAVRVRNPRLRWPVAPELSRLLPGQKIESVERRAKYLLLGTTAGSVILHLGMSGSLSVVPADTPPGPWDHLDLALESGLCLRLRDPRRFGAALWTTDPAHHALLAHLGPEPLGPDFSADYLYRACRGRRAAIKSLIMDSRVVVGVGNIYASEALFLAGIRPGRAAGRLSRRDCAALTRTIRTTLRRAIRAGGTTLRDFRQSDGQPGYFRQRLYVYGREGEPCRRCRGTIKRRVQGQRSSYYCPDCQD